MPTYEEQLRAEISQTEDQCFNLYQQIEHLEARTEGLKQALALYLKSAESAPVPKFGQTTVLSSPPRRTKRQGSRFDAVMKFIIDAGEVGVTIEEMHAFAVNNGLKLKRTSIRSNVWNRKKSGELENMGDGRYRYGLLTGVVSQNAEGPDGGEPSEPSLKLVGAA
ncbi:MAG: hypothetical protein ACLQJR_26680 [Stellaceae bacterium]